MDSDDVDIREPSWGHVFNIAKHVAKAALGRSRKEYACSRKLTFANWRSLLRSQQAFPISEPAWINRTAWAAIVYYKNYVTSGSCLTLIVCNLHSRNRLSAFTTP